MNNLVLSLFESPELTKLVAQYLTVHDIAHCILTCKTLSRLFEPYLWRQLLLRNHSHYNILPRNPISNINNGNRNDNASRYHLNYQFLYQNNPLLLCPPSGFSRNRHHLHYFIDLAEGEAPIEKYLEIMVDGLPLLPALSDSAEASTPTHEATVATLTESLSTTLSSTSSNSMINLRELKLSHLTRSRIDPLSISAPVNHLLLLRILHSNSNLTHLDLPVTVLTQDPLLVQCFLDVISTNLQHLQRLILNGTSAHSTSSNNTAGDIISAETSVQFLGTCLQHPRLRDLQCNFTMDDSKETTSWGGRTPTPMSWSHVESGQDQGGQQHSGGRGREEEELEELCSEYSYESFNRIPNYETQLLGLLKTLSVADRAKEEAGLPTACPLLALKLPATRFGYPDSFLDRFLLSLENLERLNITDILEGHEDELEPLVEECCPKLRHIDCSFDYTQYSGKPIISVIHGCATHAGLISFRGFGYDDQEDEEQEKYYKPSTTSSSSRKTIIPTVVQILVHKHSKTLEVIELPNCGAIRSKDLQLILTTCPRLRRLWVWPENNNGQIALEFVDVVKDEWVCLGLEELQLTLTRQSDDHSQLTGSADHSIKGKETMPYYLRQPVTRRRGESYSSFSSDRQMAQMAKEVYAQIGRLINLRSLVLGCDKDEPSDLEYFAKDLTLNRGYLSELSKLKELRHFGMTTNFWLKMRQAETKFMLKQWPKLERITFGEDNYHFLNHGGGRNGSRHFRSAYGHGYDYSCSALLSQLADLDIADEDHWQLMQEKRPWLRFVQASLYKKQRS
ncbi:hypothetical protein BX616_007953 [Lobosporangium transversale]|uniref:F-box domain-containing protein n=1 Tax=Lobosporangium transversale TaxID=64571 RepID=A0A1Y2GYG1_9FUNG|nr:hypothetical protein BCR41DRAFT_346661 [Lobosporangium transversale]KAF9914599.1 hypothetical protein BX616_007953 [Lobosporangium transversale]ORZ27329.1 hypothetical protein BCR41DRAFT_346661 [Lobosporangium transversale]|eukprot:XP_021885056.1 hypothetical protein BCR41DRAFT_346661 [Lobosporangium transversale]